MRSFRPVLAAALVACAIPLTGSASATCLHPHPATAAADPYVCYSQPDGTLLVYLCLDGGCQPQDIRIGELSDNVRTFLQEVARDLGELLADVRDSIPDPSPGVPQP